MRASKKVIGLIAACVLLAGAAPATLSSDTSASETRLLDTLRRSIPDSDSAARISHLIDQLGDPNFDVREQASDELSGWPNLDGKLLEEAATSPDPEVRRRASRVRQRIRQSSEAQLRAALHAVERR